MRERTGTFWAAWLGVIFLSTIFLSGCWDRREINELAFLSCFAADLEGERRIITSEIIRPAAVAGGGEGGGGGGTAASLPQRNVIIGSESGDTFYAAGRRLAMRLPRRVYVAHTTAVLVGEEMARRGFKEVLDFLDRQHEHRRSTLILVTRGPAREVLIRAQGGLEATLGREIAGLAKWVKVTGFGYIPTIHDVLVDLSGGAAATLIPVLEISPQPLPPILGAGSTGGAGSGGGSAQGASKIPEPQVAQTVRLNGAGLFHHDRLVGWLDPNQTRGWAWVKNQVKRALLELEAPENQGKVSVEITEARGKAEVQTLNGQLQGAVKVKVEGNLLEQQGFYDFTREEAIRFIENQMAAVIAQEIRSAILQAQKAGADVFDFGGALSRKEPKLWKQVQTRWDEEFKKMPIGVEVEARLRRTGLTGPPWRPKAR
ncbi:MAG: Ger(x)C family spore germination protein [Moorellaceae bacterium]